MFHIGNRLSNQKYQIQNDIPWDIFNPRIILFVKHPVWYTKCIPTSFCFDEVTNIYIYIYTHIFYIIHIYTVFQEHNLFRKKINFGSKRERLKISIICEVNKKMT